MNSYSTLLHNNMRVEAPMIVTPGFRGIVTAMSRLEDAIEVTEFPTFELLRQIIEVYPKLYLGERLSFAIGANGRLDLATAIYDARWNWSLNDPALLRGFVAYNVKHGKSEFIDALPRITMFEHTDTLVEAYASFGHYSPDVSEKEYADQYFIGAINAGDLTRAQYLHKKYTIAQATLNNAFTCAIKNRRYNIFIWVSQFVNAHIEHFYAAATHFRQDIYIIVKRMTNPNEEQIAIAMAQSGQVLPNRVEPLLTDPTFKFASSIWATLANHGAAHGHADVVYRCRLHDNSISFANMALVAFMAGRFKTADILINYAF